MPSGDAELHLPVAVACLPHAFYWLSSFLCCPFPLPILLFPGIVAQINYLPLNPCLRMSFLGNPAQNSSPYPHLLLIVELQAPAKFTPYQDFWGCPGGSHIWSETSLVSYDVCGFFLFFSYSGHPCINQACCYFCCL